MADRNPYLYVLLLSNVMIVNGYLQFVVPSVTQTDSSPIFSSGTHTYWSNRTVDGNFSQSHQACLHTAITDVSEAWLRVDLQAVRSVKFVKFWYRNDRGSAFLNTIRLQGYSIRVSNTSHVSTGSADVCFTDYSSSTLPTVIQEECERTTRYVWFYQVHIRDSNYKVPILEICEVQIFGCETGTYDISCSKTCSHCKNNETCDIDTGECDDNGCALPGFKSPMCGDCLSGLYGKKCNLNCSQFCHGKVCYQTTGECVNGCEDGYIGGLCTILCPNGYFGRKCLETCGKCLNDQTCNNVNGTCIDGCNAGFKGDLCKTVLENMDETVSSDAVTSVTTTQFVTPFLEIVANAQMVLIMLNVQNNVIVGIMERVVCFNVDSVWIILPVTTLMAPVPVDVWQDGRTQISVIHHARMALLECCACINAQDTA